MAFFIPSPKQILSTIKIVAVVGALGFGISFINEYRDLKADKIEAELTLNLRAEEIERLRAVAVIEAENRVIAEDALNDLDAELEVLQNLRNQIDTSEGNDAEVAPVLNDFLNALDSR